MNAFNTVKAQVEQQATEVLIQSLLLLEAKNSLEEHERLVRAALCDVIEDREGLDLLEVALDEKPAA